VSFSSFLDRNLRFGSHAAQCPTGSDSFCIKAVFSFIRLMTSLCGPCCRCIIFACWQWQRVLFRSIHQGWLSWLHYWARYQMFQDMDTIEASCVFYVKVGIFTHLEQFKICFLTVNTMGIVRLTVQHDLIVSVSFMKYPRDTLRQTSADILSLKQCPIYICQSYDFSYHTLQCIPANTE